MAAPGDRYECPFYLAGDGRDSGTPVLDTRGVVIGHLPKGSHRVICQSIGRRALRPVLQPLLGADARGQPAYGLGQRRLRQRRCQRRRVRRRQDVREL